MRWPLIVMLAALAAAAAGAAVGWAWLVAGGLVTAVWCLLIDGAEEPSIRGALAFLGVPVTLAAVTVAA